MPSLDHGPLKDEQEENVFAFADSQYRQFFHYPIYLYNYLIDKKFLSHLLYRFLLQTLQT